MPTNHGKDLNGEYRPPAGDIVNYPKPDDESVAAGYEMTDVNAGGVVVFLGGLFGFVIIFFFFCFLMGKVINNALNKQDGPTDKWHQSHTSLGTNDVAVGGKKPQREDLKSNAAMEQEELNAATKEFPQPRLDIDDGNQAIADLHAREDLLLNHYSTNANEPMRIPISRAMELIATRGLPVAQAGQTGTALAHDSEPTVQAPLTSGFARTGYELDTIEARRQKMDFQNAEHAEVKK